MVGEPSVVVTRSAATLQDCISACAGGLLGSNDIAKITTANFSDFILLSLRFGGALIDVYSGHRPLMTTTDPFLRYAAIGLVP
jgi:hypothetical protein